MGCPLAPSRSAAPRSQSGASEQPTEPTTLAQDNDTRSELREREQDAMFHAEWEQLYAKWRVECQNEKRENETMMKEDAMSKKKRSFEYSPPKAKCQKRRLPSTAPRGSQEPQRTRLNWPRRVILWDPLSESESDSDDETELDSRSS